ncbi:ferric reductase-like transmembrane domain-containing protein [Avibacterium sp. 20-15]|uniref:sulfite oxidase heme-binding subunit YedZ n=1 Tax=unclassified Avibacterium TaxID=2685287 RepID=UPI002027206B|nr:MULTISPECIES: ferric reductase-like transmembrane domain-containing protein [unclassified Avibacterium]MCW9733428.1 ferric reductase-like transmembrane domain-containing protein [Avibacterium sp. 20-15]URL01585.1 ferric reductase-like transmembrane domain-containing protein [Avibacterium sp. 20-126]URL03298.1 ferric reductase-like transmembrane domain-containing protein [Avibacterium sp. 20-132]
MKQIHLIAHLCASSPLLWLVYELGINNGESFGADPTKELIHFLGWISLSLFLALFLFRLIIQLLGRKSLSPIHKIIGLWAIGWAFLHILAYLYLELGFNMELFLSEILTHPYLWVGVTALLLFCVSTTVMLPALRQYLKQKTFILHQFNYLALGCASIHYYWSTKSYNLNAIIYLLFAFSIVAYFLYQRRPLITMREKNRTGKN